MNARKTKWGLTSVALAILVSGAGFAQTGKLEALIGAANDGNKVAQESQVRIDKLSQETQTLLDKYKETLRNIETLKTYNAQLDKLVSNQNAEMASFQQQIDSVTVIEREITPLMLDMVTGLEQFVSLDVPFLEEERKNRVLDLQELMDRANVSSSEKFRRVLEAYQIENEYGWTVEAYTGTLALDGGERQVDYLRIGRISYLYQTPDGDRQGVWNQKSRQWEELGSEYRTAIRQGLRIARKQAAPDLLQLPISAPESVQ